jgi:hypothetical protein
VASADVERILEEVRRLRPGERRRLREALDHIEHDGELYVSRYDDQ